MIWECQTEHLFSLPPTRQSLRKGSALGGFGLCWKRFCYADMLLVVPLVISLVYLKVPDCSRCHVSTFSMKTYENKAYIFSIVEKQMLRWWLWTLGCPERPAFACTLWQREIHTDSAVPPICFVCSNSTVSYGPKLHTSAPLLFFFCKRRPLVRNEAMHGATFGASKRWTSKCGKMISGVIVVYDELKTFKTWKLCHLSNCRVFHGCILLVFQAVVEAEGYIPEVDLCTMSIYLQDGVIWCVVCMYKYTRFESWSLNKFSRGCCRMSMDISRLANSMVLLSPSPYIHTFLCNIIYRKNSMMVLIKPISKMIRAFSKF